MLSEKGITQPEDLPQTEASGQVAEIRSAVLEGNTYYFLRLEGEEIFYSINAAKNPLAVILNVGDTVTIQHAVGEDTSILEGYTLTVQGKAAPQEPLVSETPAEEEAGPADPQQEQPQSEG